MQHESMIVDVISAISEVSSVQWDGLMERPHPFMAHGFLSALEESGSVRANVGWQPAHALLRSNSGEVLAAVPGYVKQHSMGEYVFDHAWAQASERAGIAYYPKWLIAVPFSPVCGPRVIGRAAARSALLMALPNVAAQLELSGIHLNFPDQDLDTRELPGAGWLERLGCQFHWHNRGFRDSQDFFDTLASRKRKQMRKERALVQQQGIEFEWLSAGSLTELQWDVVYACYANTYHVRGRMPYLTRDFFSLIGERMTECARVLWVSRGGQALATALYFVDETTLYGRYWGCLEEVEHLHFEACLYQGMEYAINQGLARFDAGAQGEHKLLRGFEPTLTHSWHYLGHERLREAVAEFLGRERHAVVSYARAAALQLPFRRI